MGIKDFKSYCNEDNEAKGNFALIDGKYSIDARDIIDAVKEGKDVKVKARQFTVKMVPVRLQITKEQYDNVKVAYRSNIDDFDEFILFMMAVVEKVDEGGGVYALWYADPKLSKSEMKSLRV